MRNENQKWAVPKDTLIKIDWHGSFPRPIAMARRRQRRQRAVSTGPAPDRVPETYGSVPGRYID